MADLGPLIGSWRLQSASVTFSDNGESVAPHGANPVGWMVLSPTGRIMFLFGVPGREVPNNEADKASLFRSMVAYTGRVRRTGPSSFVTTVDLAMDPGIRGEQVRLFTIEGDRLSIRTPEQTISIFGDRLLVADLVWIREQD